MIAKVRSTTRGFFLKSSYAPPWSIPIALLVLTLLSYGLRAFSLGFFWDDWPYLWFFHRFGPSGIISAFSNDRPFLSFIYNLSLTALGHSSQGWQAYGLLARWLCGVGLWWALAQAWPKQSNKAAWAAFLFTIYPGFTQQWISVIYAQAFILFAALFFSVGITAWMARRTLKPGIIAAGTLLALGLSAFCMFSTEYFFGVEMLRPILLWLIFANACNPKTGQALTIQQRVRHTVLWWAPYLALMLFFVFWRMIIHPFTGYDLSAVNQIEGAPLNGVRDLLVSIIHYISVTGLAAWGQSFQPFTQLFQNGISAGFRLLVLVIGSGLLVFFYFTWLRPHLTADTQNTAPEADRFAGQAILAGTLTVLAAGLPTWITKLPVEVGFPLDRYSLAISTGVCLLFAGLIDAFGKTLIRKAAMLGIIIALAVGFHNNTALSYRADWNMVRDFFWQLTWRAPSVKPNTLFASDSMPFHYFEDDSLTAPLNWTYDPNGTSQQMPYILYDLLVRKNSLPQLVTGEKVEHDFRATQFSGSTSNTLIFYYAPPGCVRILDPIYDAQLYQAPNRLIDAARISNPRALIEDTTPAAKPPIDIFGTEPDHEWCYYFEKAELAKQQKDWKNVASLGKEALHNGYRPKDSSEYLTIIEGYLHSSLGDDALQLTKTAVNGNLALKPGLCALWQRSTQGKPILINRYQKAIKQTLGCTIE